jgi:GNAT superfamily N-acetyltransferase
MGKGGSAGAGGGGGITANSLAAAGISFDGSPTELKRTWKATFGAELTSASQVHAVLGLTKSDLGSMGGVEISGNQYLRKMEIRASGNGIQVGKTFRPGVVHHDHLFLAPHLQGKGLGTRMLKGQVSQYQRMGIKKINLTAAETGRYVWPKMGFRANSESMGKYRSEFKSYLKERGLPVPRKIHSVQQIARTTHKGKQVGKDFLLNHSSVRVQDMSIRVARLARNLQ